MRLHVGCGHFVYIHPKREKHTTKVLISRRNIYFLSRTILIACGKIALYCANILSHCRATEFPSASPLPSITTRDETWYGACDLVLASAAWWDPTLSRIWEE